MRRHNRLMFRTARGIVSDDADAQDVVQEAYLRAFTAMPGYRGDAALSTWLARIAINVALSLHRKQGRLVQLDEAQEANDAEPLAEDPMADLPSDHASPETQAAQAQVRLLLQRAIDDLPPLYRSVFMLRAVQEMSVDEAASALQVSADVVKTRYLRARAMLRHALRVDVGPEATQLYAFAGERCDEVVATVLAALHARGLLRPH
jgi:RNA polymerase sigma-70 factor (ECF subfamily)